ISTQTGASFDANILPGFSNIPALTTNLPQQTLYWRVQAVDAAGNVGAESAPHSLSIDTLYLPASSGVVPTGTVAFYWFAVTGATTYQVRLDVDGDGDFNTGTPRVCPANPAFVAACVIPNVPAGTHLWQVVASNSVSPVRKIIATPAGVLPAATGLRLEG